MRRFPETWFPPFHLLTFRLPPSAFRLSLSAFSHLLHPKSAQHTDKLRMIGLGKGIDDRYSSPGES